MQLALACVAAALLYVLMLVVLRVVDVALLLVDAMLLLARRLVPLAVASACCWAVWQWFAAPRDAQVGVAPAAAARGRSCEGTHTHAGPRGAFAFLPLLGITVSEARQRGLMAAARSLATRAHALFGRLYATFGARARR